MTVTHCAADAQLTPRKEDYGYCTSIQVFVQSGSSRVLASLDRGNLGLPAPKVQTFSASGSLRRMATATELPTIRTMPSSDSMPTDSPHNTYPNTVAQTMLV
jgi:hypothetical protein